MTRAIVAAFLLSGCAAKPAPQPQPLTEAPEREAAKTKSAPREVRVLEDYGAAVWVSEPLSTEGEQPVMAVAQLNPVHRATEFSIELFAPGRSIMVCNPDSSCPACKLESAELPAHLNCTLAPDSEYEVRREVTLSPRDETLEQVDLYIVGTTGLTAATPEQILLERANPIALAFTSPKDHIDAAWPTKKLATKASVHNFVFELSDIVRELGVDPLTLPPKLAKQIGEKTVLANLAAVKMPEHRDGLLREEVKALLESWKLRN